MADRLRTVGDAICGLAVLAVALGMAEAVKQGLGLAVPEPVLAVIGLVGFFIFLGRVPAPVRQVSGVLLPHMALFFIPALVGLLALSDVLATIIVPLVVIIIVSTMLPLWATAWLFQKTASPIAPMDTDAEGQREGQNADQ